MKAISINDYRELARRRLPRFLFDYVDGGAYAEVTLRRNVSALQDVALRQRVLRDVSGADLSTTLFGQSLSLPVALAPIGLAGLTARRGETQAVRAAEVVKERARARCAQPSEHEIAGGDHADRRHVAWAPEPGLLVLILARPETHRPQSRKRVSLTPARVGDDHNLLAKLL